MISYMFRSCLFLLRNLSTSNVVICKSVHIGMECKVHQDHSLSSVKYILSSGLSFQGIFKEEEYKEEEEEEQEEK